MTTVSDFQPVPSGPESKFAPVQPFHANDYEVHNTGNRQVWHDVDIQPQFDGGLTVVASSYSRELDFKPAEVSYAIGEGVDVNDIYRSFNDARNIHEITDRNPTLGLITSGLGISTSASREDGVERYDVTTTSLDDMQGRLDFIREHTGFAPKIKVAPGRKYSNDQFAEALDDESILVAGDTQERVHDLFTHFPALAVVTKSIFVRIGLRLQAIDALDPELRETARATYLRSIDRFINTMAMFDLVDKLERPDHAEGAASALKQGIGVVTGIEDSESQQREAMQLVGRIHQVATLFASQN